MPLAKDLTGVHDMPEQAIRIGDTGPQYLTGMGGSTQALATVIGGPTGSTLLECNPTSSSVSSVIFSSLTEQAKEYQLDNGSGNAMNVFPPTGGSFNGLTTNTSFSIPANKVAYVTRLGPIPPITTGSVSMGSVASDRWIFV